MKSAREQDWAFLWVIIYLTDHGFHETAAVELAVMNLALMRGKKSQGNGTRNMGKNQF